MGSSRGASTTADTPTAPIGNTSSPGRTGCSNAVLRRSPHLPNSSMKTTALLILLALRCGAQPMSSPADRPVPRADANSATAHAQLLEKAKQGKIDIYFEGDSITRRWGATDYPELLANWKQNFFGWNAADFGWGADLIQHILWRLENGELDGVHPKAIVLLAGTNNVGHGDAEEVTPGIQAIVRVMQ